MLQDRINESELLRLLDDRTRAPVEVIDNTRLPFAKAHAISAPFIVLPDYGTRSSSVVLRQSDGTWRFRERRFDASGKMTGDDTFKFNANDQA